MNKQIVKTTLTTLVGLSLSAPVSMAFAGTAGLSIDNHFDGEAEVWIDGHYEGVVKGDAKLGFSLSSGCHDVSVKRPGTDFLLASTRLTLQNNTTTLLPIYAPVGQLRVTNSGDIALNVLIEKGTSVAVAPGATAIMQVTTGHIDVVASIKEPRGEWRADERDVWVEPGQVGTLVLSPDPTVIIVTNRDAVPVRALLDGIDAGWIAAGSTERVWVRPGPTQVVLMDNRGIVRSTAMMTIKKGEEAKILVQPSVIYPVSTVPVVVTTPVVHRY